jgi:O-antigen/teichoic acid export membrane protein
MSGVRRALLLSTADRYFALVSNFVTVAIVSRVMTPEEVGVSVVGMAIVGFALSLREFSSPNFLIQHRQLTRLEIRGAFTAMLLVSLVIAAALAFAAPMLATYADARLAPYLYVIAAGILAELVAMPIMALLRRDMQFGKAAAVNIAGSAVGAVVTISLALLHFSYMSFAWAWLSTAVTTGALALSLSGSFWIFMPSHRGLHEMIRFGGFNGLNVMLYRAYDAVPALLIGRLLSLDAAALFSRTQMICQLPDKIFLSGAVSVVLPAFAAEARQGRSLKAPYLNALGFITVLQWPALVVLAILAHPVVNITFGHQWGGVAPLVQIAALASLFTFSFELNYPVLVSMGAVRDIVTRSLIIFPVSAVILAIASLFGLRAVAYGLLLAIPFQAFVSLQFIRRHIAIDWQEIAGAVWKSAAVTAFSALGPILLVASEGFRFELSIGEGSVAAVLAGVGWFGGLWLTRHPFLDEIARTLKVVKLPGRLPARISPTA